MSRDIRILREMISGAATIPIQKTLYGKRYATLSESRDPKRREVMISGLPDNTIIIKADAFQSPDTIFNCSKGECKRADFIIVADTDKKRVILYIEMKATRKGSSEKEIIRQLKGAQCFIGYCRNIGKSFWESPNFLDGYECRFIKIIPNNVSKGETRISRETGVHDKPEKMLTIDSPKCDRLDFKHLVGKGNPT
uniref:Uncharacterized protein n=1 Tax=Candidatus Kentrum sp. MB TaxID=2138164 RepID=A0A451BGG1_9GAMM|nr:MAG: hypothetical protein BECKMB1821G_GA0114241_107611 [Candidatus Kentron sp. MB]VFK35578.1 MAG: hypothetical protein BECKMB1821I_GA0114274_11292 [Candidatus Kentron sp. MB]VFK77385.1 MAG: hypothetical protein BECKMB1821H_GA0114242_11312 [Candidatus Kentron sp. MB]